MPRDTSRLTASAGSTESVVVGGEAEPAAHWHRRAAERIAGSNPPEARRHWTRVRELAEQIGDPALALELGQQSRVMILEYGWRLGMSANEANELLREGEEWPPAWHRVDDLPALAFANNRVIEQGVARVVAKLATKSLYVFFKSFTRFDVFGPDYALNEVL